MEKTKLIEINDVYFISNLIKKINSNFKLFYNQNSNKYEVHNFLEKPSLIISFSRYPDYGLIEKLYYTNKDNMKNLFKNIELSNKNIEIKQQEMFLDKSNQQLNEIFHYELSNPGKTLSKKQIEKILEKGEQND